MTQELTLSGLTKFDDRQLPSPFMEANDQLGARDFLRLRPRLLDHRSTIVDLSRSSTIESLMRTRVFKPPEIAREFAPHVATVQRNEDAPQPLVLERKEEALDDGRCSKAPD